MKPRVVSEWIACQKSSVRGIRAGFAEFSAKLTLTSRGHSCKVGCSLTDTQRRYGDTKAEELRAPRYSTVRTIFHVQRGSNGSKSLI
jgi:hypothetical protein